MTQSINVNGKEFAIADLSEAAKAQVANLQVADGEIYRLQQQIMLAQTARNAYAAALVELLKPLDAPVEEANPAAAAKKASAKRTASKKAPV